MMCNCPALNYPLLVLRIETVPRGVKEGEKERGGGVGGRRGMSHSFFRSRDYFESLTKGRRNRKKRKGGEICLRIAVIDARSPPPSGQKLSDLPTVEKKREGKKEKRVYAAHPPLFLRQASSTSWKRRAHVRSNGGRKGKGKGKEKKKGKGGFFFAGDRRPAVLTGVLSAARSATSIRTPREGKKRKGRKKRRSQFSNESIEKRERGGGGSASLAPCLEVYRPMPLAEGGEKKGEKIG